MKKDLTGSSAEGILAKQASKQASKQAGTVQLSLFDLQKSRIKSGKFVRRISYDECRPFLMTIHYARRMCCVTDAFGLFVDGDLIGVVTYGMPASPWLCKGLAGEENVHNILELNRLALLPEYNGGNYASYLVAHSLKMLPNKTFVVSYADTAWTHVGYIYQATNFLYTGLTTPRTDTFQPDGKHCRHVEGLDNSVRQTRSAKHRYVYLVGDKRTKRQMLKELKYPVIDKYPKGDERQYDTEHPVIAEAIKVIGSDEREMETS